MEFSIESLISAVERRPELWDTNSDLYKFKSNKKEAWLQVCGEMFEDFDERAKDEQLMIEKAIVSKWRTVRDGYVRTLRKQQIVARNGSGKGNKRTHDYIYAERLHFLERIIQTKLAEEYPDMALWESFEMGDNSDEVSRLQATADQLRFRDHDPLRQDPNVDTMLLQQHLVDLSAHMKQHDALEADDNLLFFRSLLPSMKKLSSSQQLEFRVQTMQNLQRLLLEPSSNQSPHSSN